MAAPRGLFDLLDDDLGDSEAGSPASLANLDLSTRLEEIVANADMKSEFVETYCESREKPVRALKCWERVYFLLQALRTNSLFSSQERNSHLVLLRDTYVKRSSPLSINAPLELVDHFERLTQRATEHANRPFPPWLLYELRQFCESVLRQLVVEMIVEKKLEVTLAAGKQQPSEHRARGLTTFIRSRLKRSNTSSLDSESVSVSSAAASVPSSTITATMRIVVARRGGGTRWETFVCSYEENTACREILCATGDGREVHVPLEGSTIQQIEGDASQMTVEVPDKGNFEFRFARGGSVWLQGLKRARSATIKADVAKATWREKILATPVAAEAAPVAVDAPDLSDDSIEDSEEELEGFRTLLPQRKMTAPLASNEEDDSSSISGGETDFASALGAMYGVPDADAAAGAYATSPRPPGMSADADTDFASSMYGAPSMSAMDAYGVGALSAYGSTDAFVLGGSECSDSSGSSSSSSASGSEDAEENVQEESVLAADSFNERFQELMNPSEEQASHDRNASLLALAEDFLQSARRYGRIILCELFLPDEKKTIKRVAPGEDVWRVRDIVFQLAVDKNSKFEENNSSEYAAKVAGLQMQSLSAYFQSSTRLFCFPFLALIDFRGFRLSAFSALPVSESTLVYGPKVGDSGNTTFVTKSRRALAILQRFDEALNLKPSKCLPNSDKLVHGGFGQEVHRCPDKRFYMTQFSNSFPCVKPEEGIKGAEFVHHFRPEFVRMYPVPLNPNAYKIPGNSPEMVADRRAIDKATDFLENVLIPNVAKDLTKAYQQRSGVRLRISELMHEFGMNCRYMGLLVKQLTIENPLHISLVVEMVARVAKNQLRSQLRQRMRALRVSSDNPYITLIVVFMNLVFGRSPAALEWWNVGLKSALLRSFRLRFLGNEDWCDLRKYVFEHQEGPLLLFQRIGEMTGIEFSPSIAHIVEFEREAFRKKLVFNDSDVLSIGERTKQLDLVWNAKGFLFMARATRQESRGFFKSARHFYTTALDSFTFALSVNPTNSILLNKLGEVLLKICRLSEAVSSGSKNLASIQLQPHHSLVLQARSAFARAISADASDPYSFAHFAHLLEASGDMELAEDYFLQALLLDPSNHAILRKYGHFLSNIKMEHETAALFYERSQQARVVREQNN